MFLEYKITLLVTSLLTALITGLLYAFSCSVNPGLARLDDASYLRAMQSINAAILNPLFFLSFMGTLVLLPLCTWLHYLRYGKNLGYLFLLAATIIYIMGVFGVTITGNVPLNNYIEKLNLRSAAVQELQRFRNAFERPWNRLHFIRTLFSIIALLLVLATSIFKK